MSDANSTPNTLLDDLEARRIEVEIRKLEAEAKKLEAEAHQAEIFVVRQQNNNLLDADLVRTVRLSDVITSGVVDRVMARMDALLRLDREAPIELIIDCPGGSVLSGFELYDRLMELRAQGATINVTIFGMGASMASIISQVGETRRMGVNAYLMIHEISVFQFGTSSITEIQDEAEVLKRFNSRLVKILETRALATPTAEEKLTAEVIKKKTNRKKDWWLDAEEALKYGLIDAIVDAPLASVAVGA